MPTAVITESSEKTISSSMIWMMTLVNDDGGPSAPVLSCALELLVDLERRFAEQEETAAEENQVAAGDILVDDREERVGQADDPRDRRGAAGCA